MDISSGCTTPLTANNSASPDINKPNRRLLQNALRENPSTRVSSISSHNQVHFPQLIAPIPSFAFPGSSIATERKKRFSFVVEQKERPQFKHVQRLRNLVSSLSEEKKNSSTLLSVSSAELASEPQRPSL